MKLSSLSQLERNFLPNKRLQRRENSSLLFPGRDEHLMGREIWITNQDILSSPKGSEFSLNYVCFWWTILVTIITLFLPKLRILFCRPNTFRKYLLVSFFTAFHFLCWRPYALCPIFTGIIYNFIYRLTYELNCHCLLHSIVNWG